MKDLSLSGAIIVSEGDLRTHIPVEVSVALPRPSSRAAVTKARDARQFNEGVGIEWCEFAHRAI